MAKEDIQAVAKNSLRHRILLNFEGEAEGISTDDLIDGVIVRLNATVRTPIDI